MSVRSPYLGRDMGTKHVLRVTARLASDRLRLHDRPVEAGQRRFPNTNRTV